MLAARDARLLHLVEANCAVFEAQLIEEVLELLQVLLGDGRSVDDVLRRGEAGGERVGGGLLGGPLVGHDLAHVPQVLPSQRGLRGSDAPP